MAKTTVKKRKNTMAPLTVAKRLKVQAQRKFAFGATFIPVQITRETVVPIVTVPFKQPPQEIKLNVNPSHKASTEDFLTFLCFKGTSEIPTDSVLLQQTQSEQINTGKNLLPVEQPVIHNSIDQPSTSVQGFIPFGVRKQASQFPARNNQIAIQALRTKYNREKQAKLCALAFKKSGVVGSQPKRVQTRSTKDVKPCKPISKAKVKCISPNVKAVRQPPGKPIIIPNLPTKRVQSNLAKNVSLRNRVVSVHSAKTLPRGQLPRGQLPQVKKPVIKIKRSPLSQSKVVAVNKLVKQSKDVKQDVQTERKTIQKPNLLKVPTSNKANVRQSPRNVIITRKTAFSRNNLKANLLNTSSFCLTRAGTVRKFVPPSVKSKILDIKEQKDSPRTATCGMKKKASDVIDFSSDDDEPLYKKLATDIKPQNKNVADIEKVVKLNDTKPEIKVIAKVHGTRRNVKNKSFVLSSLNNSPVVKISPNDKTLKMESNARTTRRNSKRPTRVAVINKSKLNASPSPSKLVPKRTRTPPSQTSTKNCSILKDKKIKVDIAHSDDVNGKNKEPVEVTKTDLKTNDMIHNAKRRKVVSSSDLISTSETKPVKELEKSFSDSDEEPLAAKIIETMSKSSNTTKRLIKPKKVSKNKSKSGTPKKPNLSILIDTETREIADKHVKIISDTSIPNTFIKKEINPILTQEGSSKVVNASKGEEIRKTNSRPPKSKVLTGAKMPEAKRKSFVGISSSQMPSVMSKSECKDNRNRKFIKSKEYIERWLDSSLRLAADSDTELMSIRGAKNVTPVNLPHVESVSMNMITPTDIGNKNLYTSESNSAVKLFPDKKRIIENRRTQIQPAKQNTLLDTSKELMDSTNIAAFSKLGLSDPSSNIYEFDSESEMAPFARKSSSAKPSDDCAWKPKFSKDLSKGKASTPLYNTSKRRMHSSFAVEESDSSASKVVTAVDNCNKLTPVQSTVQSEPTEFPISSTAEDSSLDVHTLVTSEDMPTVNHQLQPNIVSESNIAATITETIGSVTATSGTNTLGAVGPGTFSPAFISPGTIGPGNTTPGSIGPATITSLTIGSGTISSGTSLSNSKEDDSEGHLFYIPLQGVTKTGVNMEHLIQGVAVKLGPQGPDGSQQRVIMRAKLVTKSQVGSNQNVSENLANQVGPVQDMMRSVLGTIPTTTHFQSSFKPLVEKKSIDAQTPSFTINTNITSASPAAPKVNPGNKMSVEYIPVLHGSSKSSSGSSPRSTNAQKRGPIWNTEVINHTNNTAFPQIDDQARMVEAPVFRPTEKEFQDPLEFIEKISPVAARYGLCRIIPPANFKSECKISDDMRFTPHNQYLHRMLYRWGPSSREMCAIKKYLATQSVSFKQPPSLSNIEVDLPKLYHIVQNMGGLKKVLEKKMWLKVAEEMCIPYNVNYMDIRLDEIYCKYLLPYDTLSVEERRKLFESVDFEWEKRQSRMVYRAANPLSYLCEPDADDQEYDITEDIEECITRGKSTTLCSFARTAKNTLTMHYGKTNVQPTPDEVESKFWQYVTSRKSHVCVSTGSIDSSVWGYGFPNAKTKNTPISKHPWNLKVLTNNSGSVLRSLGPMMGVTVPTLHVGMTFSACCWYRDPHGLPWIEYLHEGAQKIWYGVPDSQSAKFKDALTSIVPGYCQRKTIWLLSDTTMVPPTMLTEHGVSLCRTVQQPGEYILVFPKAFTSSICTGYNVSESVYFANTNWLDTASQDFTDIRNSCEPSMFSLERLVVAISEDVRSSYQALKKILPTLNKIIQTEKHHRERLFNFGLKLSERSQILTGKKKIAKSQDEAEECHRCRTSLYLSMFYASEEGSVYCLLHGAEFLAANPGEIENCKLVYLHSIHELNKLLSNLIERINHLANKKSTKLK